MKQACAPAHTHARVFQENGKQGWQLEGTKGSAPVVIEAEGSYAIRFIKENQNFPYEQICFAQSLLNCLWGHGSGS